ncbi:unnamed protein product [Amoebophrya sp. A25]|nr:unnamed protein product [Amoebophrya sp. A25]|eukprot:GSA25T00012240001.1
MKSGFFLPQMPPALRQGSTRTHDDPSSNIAIMSATSTVGSGGVPPWVFGVALQNASSFTCTLGLVLQKWATSRGTDVVRWVWAFGFALFILGQLLMPPALTMAPQSVLSCLTPTTLLFNSFLTPCILSERFTAFHALSILFIFVGCVVTVRFGMHPEAVGVESLDLNRTLYLGTRPLFLALVLASLLVAVSVARPVLSWRLSGKPVAALAQKVTPLQLILLSTIFGAISVTNTKIVSTLFADGFLAARPTNGNSVESSLLPHPTSTSPGDTSSVARNVVLDPQAGANVQGAFEQRPRGIVAADSGLSIVTAAGASSSTSIEQAATTSSNPLAWLFLTPTGLSALVLILFGIAGVAVFSISLLNLSMFLFSSLTTVTLNCALGLVMQLIYGAVYFEEYKFYTMSTASATLCGICFSLLGMGCLYLQGKNEEGQPDGQSLLSLQSGNVDDEKSASTSREDSRISMEIMGGGGGTPSSTSSILCSAVSSSPTQSRGVFALDASAPSRSSACQVRLSSGMEDDAPTTSFSKLVDTEDPSRTQDPSVAPKNVGTRLSLSRALVVGSVSRGGVPPVVGGIGRPSSSNEQGYTNIPNSTSKHHIHDTTDGRKKN